MAQWLARWTPDQEVRVRALDRSLCCVLGQDTLLSQWLSPPRGKWVPANCQGNLTKCWEVTCYGLAWHPGRIAIFLVASCYRNRDTLRLSWATRLITRLNHHHFNKWMKITLIIQNSCYNCFSGCSEFVQKCTWSLRNVPRHYYKSFKYRFFPTNLFSISLIPRDAYSFLYSFSELVEIKGAFFWDYSGIGILGIYGICVILGAIPFS